MQIINNSCLAIRNRTSLYRSLPLKSISRVTLRIALLITSVVLLVVVLWKANYRLAGTDYRYFQWPPEANTSLPADGIYNRWEDYLPMVEPHCDKQLAPNRTLLIVVKSAPYRYVHRQAVRALWGHVTEVDGFQVRAVFVMGHTDESGHSLNSTADGELFTYRDMLIGNFTDTYDANIQKFILSINYAMDYCGLKNGLPFMFLVDDDHFVVVRNLVAELHTRSPNDEIYMGHAQNGPEPIRDPLDKNFVMLSEYPFDRYPPFISAGAVLLSRRTIELFHDAIPVTKLYRMDDVYAGILALQLGVVPQNNTNFRFIAAGPGDASLQTGIAAHGFRMGT